MTVRPPLTAEEAHERIKQGAKNRHHARNYARAIVKRWPDLGELERIEVREILSPIITRVDANGGRDA